jgi:hypothetical protein
MTRPFYSRATGYSRAFPENSFRINTRIAYLRILVLPLNMHFFQGFQQHFAGCSSESALFSQYWQHNAVMMTTLLVVHYSRAAAHLRFVPSNRCQLMHA